MTRPGHIIRFLLTTMLQRASVSLITGSLVFALPVMTFAAGTSSASSRPAATDAVTEEILDKLDQTEPATPLPAPAAQDGRGGGDASMSIYPGSPAGIHVDASVTKEVTPDYLSINAYCDSGKKPSRDLVRDALNQIYEDIKDAVGKDGRIRRTGSVSVYPVYAQGGDETGSYTGNMSLTIRILNKAAASRIYDYVEGKGCGPNWDVRLVDTLSHETKVLNELTDRLQKRKTVFEKLFGRKLSRVLSASINTWVDGYGTYDPETNTADATTTLSVTFDPGTRAMLPTRTTR